ncbi:SOS response-associated peptidase family protein [Microbacterium sp. NPDC008134]|uniref:SOS response-associated peptidase family protein n=1 Tax=Microbacterium sp. NPDC008134 TaxID=3364183 RepID=UPI0036EDF8F2
MFAAAGLTWSMDVKGEQVRCFVVITREARDAGGEVHDRMPAFLTDDAMDEWLEPVKLDRPGRDNTIATLDGSSEAVASTIQQYIVERKLNNSRTANAADPTLVEPAGQ